MYFASKLLIRQFRFLSPYLPFVAFESVATCSIVVNQNVSDKNRSLKNVSTL